MADWLTHIELPLVANAFVSLAGKGEKEVRGDITWPKGQSGMQGVMMVICRCYHAFLAQQSLYEGRTNIK